VLHWGCFSINCWHPTKILKNKTYYFHGSVVLHILTRDSIRHRIVCLFSRPITAVVSHFLQANASRLWAQVQLEEIIRSVGLWGRALHNISSHCVSQTENVNTLHLLACSKRVECYTSMANTFEKSNHATNIPEQISLRWSTVIEKSNLRHEKKYMLTETVNFGIRCARLVCGENWTQNLIRF
jgi:hypothetical protein